MLCVFGRWTNPLFLCKPACKWTRVSPETLRSAGNSALHFAFPDFFLFKPAALKYTNKRVLRICLIRAALGRKKDSGVF